LKKTKIDLSTIDTVILAGGLGTRLKPVLKDKPKCLAPINGKPFIDILLDECIDQGLRRFILCVGYLKEQVIEHLSDRNDCEIVFSEEDEPLGTGGAVKNAEPLIKSDPVLVMNGDSISGLRINDMLLFHAENIADGCIAIRRVKNSKRYGQVVLDELSRIILFKEKNGAGKSIWISTGIYVLTRNLFSYFRDQYPYSIETDIFPIIVKKQKILGFKTQDYFLDIGIPEALIKAKSLL